MNPAIGEIILRGERECQVIGIIGEFRNGGRFTGSSRIIFERITLDHGSRNFLLCGRISGQQDHAENETWLESTIRRDPY